MVNERIENDYGMGVLPYSTGVLPYDSPVLPYGMGALPYGINIYSQPTEIKRRTLIPIWIFVIAAGLLGFYSLYYGNWKLSLIPIILFSIFCKKLSAAVMIGMIGNGGSWLCYILISFTKNDAFNVLTKIFQILTGYQNSGWVLFAIIMAIALLLGFLSSIFGYNLKEFVRKRLLSKKLLR